MIRYSSLPPDMKVLISDFVCGIDREAVIPEFLPTRQIKLADIPDVPLDEYDRGTLYARKMTPEQTPPLIVAYNHFIDGKHRRFSFHEQGLCDVTVIDLTGIAEPRMVEMNSMGELGARVAIHRHEDYPDMPQYAVWDYSLNAFLGKNDTKTQFLDEAIELSRNQISDRYRNTADYLIFIPYSAFDHEVELVLEQRIETDGWAWRFESCDIDSTEWKTSSSAEACIKDAVEFAHNQMVNTRTPNPFYMRATKSPMINSLDSKLQTDVSTPRARRGAVPSVFDWG